MGQSLREVETKMCEHEEQYKFRANGLEYCTQCNKYTNIGFGKSNEDLPKPTNNITYGKSNEDLAKPTNKITCPRCGSKVKGVYHNRFECYNCGYLFT